MKFRSVIWSIMSLLFAGCMLAGCSDDDENDDSGNTDTLPRNIIVSSKTGDMDGLNKHSALVFNVKSDFGDDFVYMLADNSKEGEKLTDEAYVDRILSERGTKMQSEDVTAVKSQHGLDVLFENLISENKYTFIIRVSDKDGTLTKMSSLATDVKPADSDAPVISLTGCAGDGSGNDRESKIMFTLRCSSKDATYAEFIVSDRAQVDQLLGKGLKLEEIAEGNKGNGLIFTAEALAKLNNRSYVLTFDNTDGVIPDTEFTCIAIVENAKGKMSVARCDVKTDPVTEDNTPPVVEVNGFAGDASGENKNTMVTFNASCTSKNAFYAEAYVVETTNLNEILNGITVEELMKYNEGIGRILPQTDLDLLNDGLLSIVWDQMQGDTGYTLLLCVKTRGGGMTVKRCDVKTAPDPDM